MPAATVCIEQQVKLIILHQKYRKSFQRLLGSCKTAIILSNPQGFSYNYQLCCVDFKKGSVSNTGQAGDCPSSSSTLVCLAGRRASLTPAQMWAPGSGTAILRASLSLSCPPVCCALITEALKHRLPLAPSLLQVNWMVPVIMSGTQPFGICRFLKIPHLE